MFNLRKQSASNRTHPGLMHPARPVAGLVLALALGLGLLTGGATPAHAAEAPPQNPGCETYGCLYEHCPTYYTRGSDNACDYGVAYQRLPDGPDNRRFVGVMWPEHYQPERRDMWDNVAYCESTWRWDINNGNGFHGGVQFHPNTWNAYGGGEYASSAWQATPEQQISVAERVAYYGWTRPDGSTVPPQGPRAWPRCGRYLAAPAA